MRRARVHILWALKEEVPYRFFFVFAVGALIRVNLSYAV